MQISREFVVQTGGRAILPCPYRVGTLSGCYFGSWYRNETMIIQVSNPSVHCTSPQNFQVADGIDLGGRYLLDQSNFSLIIDPAEPCDSNDYRCELSALDPVSIAGMTINYGRSVAHSLSVIGGKFICRFNTSVYYITSAFLTVIQRNHP